MPKKVFISQGTIRTAGIKPGRVGPKFNHAGYEQLAQKALAEVDDSRAREQELEARERADKIQKLFYPEGPYVVGTSRDYRTPQQAQA